MNDSTWRYQLQRRIPASGRSILLAVFWVLIFSLAYSQSPLYTSNQNQYFLHGLAQAGYGDLARDWLANTSDPTPVFSLMVSFIYRYLRWEQWFYLVYALLMGIYLYSLWGIASLLYDLRASPVKKLLFLSLLVTVYAAGLRFVLSRVVGVNWTYILEDGLADQRLLGTVLQPSAFGVFLLLSIYLFLKRKLVLAVLAAVLAATIHPTYLLSAAVLTLAYLLSTAYDERSLKKVVALGVIALVGVLPITLASFPVFVSASSGTVERARQILVEYRIPHHALVSWWFDATAVVKILLIAMGLYLARRSRLFLVMLICVVVAVTFSLLQLAMDSRGLALLFPWRLSTFLLPLSMTLILAYIVDRAMDSSRLNTSRAQKWVQALSIGLISLAVLVGVIRFALDQQRKTNAPERQVQAYVAANITPKDIYLVPVKMQDFRLEAGAPAFVDFKSIPYQADEVLEWYRRVGLADRFYKTGDCAVLDNILSGYPVTHVITEADGLGSECAQLDLVYDDEAYFLWEVR